MIFCNLSEAHCHFTEKQLEVMFTVLSNPYSDIKIRDWHIELAGEMVNKIQCGLVEHDALTRVNEQTHYLLWHFMKQGRSEKSFRQWTEDMVVFLRQGGHFR